MWLFVLALPVASIAWTITHEEIFREPREWAENRSRTAASLLARKFYYVCTCEYCFSHYVAAGFIALTQFQLLLADWRGYLVAWFAVVAVSTPKFIAVMHHFVIRWASTILFILVVGLVFYFVPNAKVRFRDVWVGAVVTGLLWRGALFAFGWYVRDLSRFSHIHGSIAAVVVFLVWIYTSAILLLYGVEVTAANARLRRHRPDEIPAAPAPRV